MTLVKSLVPCELISIYKHGSWYQVAFADTNRNGGKYLSTLTIQGVKNTRKHCRYYNIVHTKGTPVVLSGALDINSFVEVVDPS